MFTRIVESLNARLAALVGGVGMIALAVTTHWPEPWWGLLVGLGGLVVVLALIAFALDARRRFTVPAVTAPEPVAPTPAPPPPTPSPVPTRQRGAAVVLKTEPGGRMSNIEIKGVHAIGADALRVENEGDMWDIRASDLHSSDSPSSSLGPPPFDFGAPLAPRSERRKKESKKQKGRGKK